MLKIRNILLIFLFIPSLLFAYEPKASQIQNIPAGNLTSTNIQEVVNELDQKKQPTGNYFNKTSDTSDNITEGSTHKFANVTKEDNGQSAYGWGDHAGLYSLVNHNHDALYLGILAKATDSDKLDGQHGSYYYPASNPNGFISSYTESDPNAWNKTAVQTGLTGNKAGSFNMTTTGVIVTGNHTTASTAQVVNVCYGTGDPPTASTTPEGTIYIKYSP
ncbi:MAG: hypothetical protein ABSB18_06415 [Candidatus Omnitrophota bacterium]